MKFITPLLVYMLSFIIVAFAKYAENYSSSVRNRQQYKLISDELRQAHDRLSLPHKFICTDVNNDSKTNEADMKIPFLGMEWCRQTDTIRFNPKGSYSDWPCVIMILLESFLIYH